MHAAAPLSPETQAEAIAGVTRTGGGFPGGGVGGWGGGRKQGDA